MPEKPPVPAQAVQVQIEIDPATAVGVFVNFAMVNHNDSEFTLDLMYLQPQAPPRATVRARAIMTPKHTKRLLLALQDNIGKYEAQFGPIDLGNVPHFPGTTVN